MGRRSDIVALVAAGIVAILLATDVWPGVRGPEGARWARLTSEGPLPALAVSLPFFLIAGLAGVVRRRWATGPNRLRAPLLAAVVGLLFAQRALLAAAEPGAGIVAAPIDRWLPLALGALAVVPLVVVVGGRCAPGAVGASVLLMAVLPGGLLLPSGPDPLRTFLALTAAAFLVEAMRWASRRRAVPLAVGAGVAAGLGAQLGLEGLAALGAWGLGLAGMIALGARRSDPFPTAIQSGRIAAGLAIGFLAVPAAAVFAGTDWAAVLGAATLDAAGPDGPMPDLPPSGRILGSFGLFVLFLGPGLVVAWLVRVGAELRAFGSGAGFVASGTPGRPGPPLEVPFALALLVGLVGLVGLVLAGRPFGEAGGGGLFLLPLAVAAAASASEGRPIRDLMPLAIAQLLVLLALRQFVAVPG